MKIVEYNSISQDEWNSYVAKVSAATYMHRAEMIDYYCNTSYDCLNKSFIILKENNPVAIVPLGITKGPEKRISLGGATCAFPALAKQPYREHKKILSYIVEVIDSIAQLEQISHISFLQHPVPLSAQNNAICCENMFYPLNIGFIPSIQNHAIFDLSKDEDFLLSNISKYQKKHIKKSLQNGLQVNAFSGANGTDFSEIERLMCEFRLLHQRVAGRITRPLESWNAMIAQCKHGSGTLFIEFYENTPLSYLFCGHFGAFSFGWSQVNVPEYEEEFSPRHLLEWSAAIFYKNNGLSFYEIGHIPKFPTPSSVFSDKEISIGIFKERYGANVYPVILWEKYYNSVLLSERLNIFTNSCVAGLTQNFT